VNEHKNQSPLIGKHFSDKHCIVPKDLYKQFFVLKKCRNKFDCLVHEMLLIRELTPPLNVQSDSIRAKLVIVDTTAAPAVKSFVNIFIDFEGFLFLDLLRNTFVWHLFL